MLEALESSDFTRCLSNPAPRMADKISAPIMTLSKATLWQKFDVKANLTFCSFSCVSVLRFQKTLNDEPN